MKNKFQLDSGMDVSITLEIDTETLTAELAKEVNDFWSGADEVLSASCGCVFQAAARRAAGPLISFLMKGYHEAGAVSKLSEQEGWPKNLGISIVAHKIPCFDAEFYDVKEIA